MSRAETMGIAHVVWVVSAIYFLAGPGFAYWAALVGFGLVAVGFSYSAFRDRVVELLRSRAGH